METVNLHSYILCGNNGVRLGCTVCQQRLSVYLICNVQVDIYVNEKKQKRKKNVIRYTYSIFIYHKFGVWKR